MSHSTSPDTVLHSQTYLLRWYCYYLNNGMEMLHSRHDFPLKGYSMSKEIPWNPRTDSGKLFEQWILKHCPFLSIQVPFKSQCTVIYALYFCTIFSTRIKVKYQKNLSSYFIHKGEKKNLLHLRLQSKGMT